MNLANMQSQEPTDREREEARQERLEAFGLVLKGKRDDAINGRVNSGIEQIWLEDEEFYEGIDDANRDKVLKPATINGQFTTQRDTGRATRSSVFLNITGAYVDAASARVADMLLPTDDKNGGLKPTPMPQLAGMAEDGTPLIAQDGQPVMNGQQPVTKGDWAKQQMAEAKRKCENAERRINDWMVECQYNGEVRKVIEDAAKVGTGVLKGPYPARSRSRATIKRQGETVLEIVDEIKPKSSYVSFWNIYPDPACGESIHNGSYLFEKDSITAKKLRDLKGTPGFIDHQIDACLREGPQKRIANSGRNESVEDKDKFQIWYFYGVADHDDLEAAGMSCPDETKVLPVIVTMVNERVVKAALAPLDSGEFPYDVMVWKRKSGTWTGDGVSRQLNTTQRMVNAGTRNMMDNAGLSSGPQIVMLRNALTPADGQWEITPRKLWFLAADAEVQDVRQAFMSFNIQSLQAELMNIIQFGMKMAEDVTGLPMIMQGQQGKAPDTVGGMQILNNNSSTVLRRIARTFDDKITVPHWTRYYDWLMEYGENDDEKGDFRVHARGSTALVERDIQNQAILQMGNMALNPAFGIDPKKWFAEAAKAQRIEPEKLQYSDEEMKAMKDQPPPEDPRVTAAKIAAESKADHAQADAHMELARQKFEAAEADKDRALEQMGMEIDAQLASAELSSEERRDLERQKVLLASLTIKIQAQRDLSTAGHMVDLHKHASPQMLTPPTEPVGRAQPGAAFQQ